MEVITKALKVVGLSYYDGVTEGFVDGLDDCETYFFKVVAWDQKQDKRLYILSKIKRAIFLELLLMLTTSQIMPTGTTWLPCWEFLNPEMTARANEIVGIGAQSLSTPDFITLGEDLITALRIERLTSHGREHAIFLAGESAPGDLSEWLDKNGRVLDL